MIEQRLVRIEQELQRILPDTADTQWFEEVCGSQGTAVDAEIVDRFCEPARDLLKRGGKRWRPLLMVLTAEALGGGQAGELAYTLAPVVELPHNGSLIIDDIEDGSDMRRGAPAVHTQYGIDISINAGNLIYYLPTVCIDRSVLHDTAKLQIYSIYSTYLRRVHFGQGFDIAWHRDLSYIPDHDSYQLMCMLKTGCLAGMASEIGAAVAGAETQSVSALGQAAQRLGVAFQVMDDVVNLETGNPGKMRGDDIIEGKKSLPMILAFKRSGGRKEELEQMIREVQEGHLRKEEVQSVIEEVITLVESLGALEEARNRAETLYEAVYEDFSRLLPVSPAREELLALLLHMKQSSNS